MLTRNKRLRDTMIGIPPKEAAGGRKRSLKLSLFVGFGESAGSDISAKSPRSFGDGAVGLGIVAAMSGAGGRAEVSRRERSEPIPIVPARPVTRLTRPEEREVEEGELSESYTCVISHVGGRPVRWRVYDGEWTDGNGGNYGEEFGVFFESPPVEGVARARAVAGFLSWCYLCGKKLHGLDIFMYRGEKAFCSVECRCQHILFDEHKEKCRSESVKPLVPSYVDRAPAPLLFCAGVAAA